MKTLLSILIFVSVSYSQNHYLSLDYNLSPGTRVYNNYSAVTLSYNYSIVNDKIHIGPFIRYYNNNISFALVGLPYSGNGPKDNGVGYGLSLNIYPIDSALLGISKILPFISFNFGKYGGNVGESSKGIYSLSKTKEGFSTTYGIGITYIENILSFYIALFYEFRNIELKKSEYSFPSPVLVSNFDADLSTTLLRFGIRFRL
jgi:hypothetical protein